MLSTVVNQEEIPTFEPKAPKRHNQATDVENKKKLI